MCSTGSLPHWPGLGGWRVAGASPIAPSPFDDLVHLVQTAGHTMKVRLKSDRPSGGTSFQVSAAGR